jgi:hypothetical protein
LKLKNLAVGTQTQYLTCCRRFAAYHMRSPREMGLEEVKEFLGHLMAGGRQRGAAEDARGPGEESAGRAGDKGGGGARVGGLP